MANGGNAQNPLPPATITAIRRSLGILQETMFLIQKAQNCGNDCRAAQALADALAARLNAILHNFGGGRPSA